MFISVHINLLNFMFFSFSAPVPCVCEFVPGTHRHKFRDRKNCFNPYRVSIPYFTSRNTMLFVESDYKGAWKDLSSVFLFFVSPLFPCFCTLAFPSCRNPGANAISDIHAGISYAVSIQLSVYGLHFIFQAPRKNGFPFLSHLGQVRRHQQHLRELHTGFHRTGTPQVHLFHL